MALYSYSSKYIGQVNSMMVETMLNDGVVQSLVLTKNLTLTQEIYFVTNNAYSLFTL